MSSSSEKKRPATLSFAVPTRSPSSGSSSTQSSLSSLKVPRTPRFAEATSVYSPVEGTNPFSDSMEEKSSLPRGQPSDVGFGYVGEANGMTGAAAVPKTPLKSALKVPGTPGRKFESLMSPTFREEDILEKQESKTDKEQARDVKIKTRVRLAKVALRGVSFSCSLIVLSMVSSSLTIFHSTKNLQAQNSLPPWAQSTSTWPQIVVLAASCVSLFIAIMIFVGYCRGGHRRAEKVNVYYTLFAVGYFIFSMVMWLISAGVLQSAKNNSNNQDLWGWSCVNNIRSELFQNQVDYALICRLQNWSLICIIIEVVVEVISISLYSIVFYRYYTKRRLTKSMDMRDRARSDLYLAQLRVQSAPNTPGFGPKSPAFSQYAMSPRFPPSAYRSLSDIEEATDPSPISRNVEPKSSFATSSSTIAMPQSPEQPFSLQAPPKKAPRATPKLNAWSPIETQAPVVDFTTNAHVPTAPEEQQYDAVPIPGAYADQHSKGM